MNEDDDALVFLPLGGVGEIGMNLGLYGCTGKWLMVDCGVAFGDEFNPGVDLYMADPAFIEERRKDLLGLVITHGHEDHIGAIAHLWPRFKCPVYATPFSAGLIRDKLDEAGLTSQVKLHVIPVGGSFKLGPFAVEYIAVTHSIPEPNALAITTRFGTVLHTGDWKLDPTPLVGPAADEARLAELGDRGVLAVVGDSTNIFVPGTTPSELGVRGVLSELIGQRSGKIAVGCFASNVARLESIALAAAEHGRKVGLFGRSLRRIDRIARECGLFGHIDEFLDEEESARLPPRRLVAICTGSQGEPRAALARVAAGAHPRLALRKGDTMIFSSRVIPGNERAIFMLQNRLARADVEIITDNDHPVHVSGHPAREEVRRLYELLRPRIVIPVHGEPRHLHEHVRFALECGVKEALAIDDGDLVRLAPGPAEIADKVPVGRLALDGSQLVRMEIDALRDRRRLGREGAAVISVALDRRDRLVGDPQVGLLGLLASSTDQIDLVEEVRDAVEALSAAKRNDDEAVKLAARMAVRRFFDRQHGKKPSTEVHILRV